MPERLNTLLAAIVRSSLNAIIVVDEAGEVIEFNPAAVATFGYPREAALGRSIGDLIVPPHLRQAHQSGMRRYLATGVPHVLNRRIEIEAMRATGEVFPVELSVTEVAADGGRYFAASLRDLSHERLIQAERDDSEARLRAFLEHAPIGMYLKDGAGRYIMANPEFTRVFGRPIEAILGRSAEDLLPPEEAAMVRGYDAEVRRTLRPVAIEEYLSGRAEYSWTLVVRFPLWSPAAEEWWIGGFDIDITPLKTAAEEVRRSQEALHQNQKLSALGTLLAGVSHELNNPLSVVLAQAEMLQMQSEGTAIAERASRIRRAAERCARIVQTFLAMARQKPPERAPVDLNAIAGAVLDLLAYGLRTGGVAVEDRRAAVLDPATGDPDQIHQVVMNLALNAIQAMEALGPGAERRLTVTTGSEPAARRVWIEIADTGPGIPEALRPRVFEPFFSTKDHGKGTGLGLSFSRAIAEAHGGALEVLPAGPGARLRLTLPAGQDAPAAATPEAGRTGPGPRRSALIVDDEAEVAETLADLLRVLGYRPTVSDCAEEAFAALARARYDLILADLRMPGTDGRAFHARLVALDPLQARRLAFVTGDVLGDGAGAFLAEAGRPVLTKPFDLAALRRLLVEVEDGARGG